MRAERAASKRQRLVEAAVELHGTVGPANTSLSSVARKAGVSRPTLYAHFPDEASLFRACTRHWMSQDPPPDPTAWLKIDDARERLGTALNEIYSHYARNEQLIHNVFRDMYQVESMRSSNAPLVEESFAAMTESLTAGFEDRPDVAMPRRAIVSVAISFNTWKTLVKTQGLTTEKAADLMAHLVVSVP